MLLDVPTQLSEKKNAEFRALFKQEYGKDITREQADELAYNLMSILAIVIEHNYNW